MIQAPTLQEVIRNHISLPARANGRGFFTVLCKVCNDHGKKGKRAGFKFEGDAVGYNCFNCGHGAGYDPAKHQSMPKDMMAVLDAFDIPKVDWEPVLFNSLVQRVDGTTPTEQRVELTAMEPAVLQLLPFFYPLTDDPTDEWAQYAIEYLQSRHVNWKSQPFYLVRKVEHPDNDRWYGRLIIPFYKDGNVIFWQGRDLTDLHVKKYLNPNVARDNILSDYREINQHVDEPLYITEGWFDAYHMNGVAVFSNKMTANQIRWINRSHRTKVVIPDKFGDGHLLAKQALELGWSVALPDIGDCKDVDAAVGRYGLLYTQKSIMSNTYSGFIAEALVELYCNGTTRSAPANKRSSSAKRF
jgi:hypothetical protein